MAEKIHEYEMVEGFISIYDGLGGNKIVFANDRLRQNEIHRGPAKKWRRFFTEEFAVFAKENGILSDTEIAIAQNGPNDIFSVIQIIDIQKKLVFSKRFLKR